MEKRCFFSARGDAETPGHPRTQEVRAAGHGGITELHQVVCRTDGTSISGRYVSGLVLLICGPPLSPSERGLKSTCWDHSGALFGASAKVREGGASFANLRPPLSPSERGLKSTFWEHSKALFWSIRKSKKWGCSDPAPPANEELESRAGGRREAPPGRPAISAT